ncbi:hypothetical protein J6590_029405 [Homalodisca vitripennis]|nr:hypothetical protein J6590_029405 [Homalodisca vitripennis]
MGPSGGQFYYRFPVRFELGPFRPTASTGSSPVPIPGVLSPPPPDIMWERRELAEDTLGLRLNQYEKLFQARLLDIKRFDDFPCPLFRGELRGFNTSVMETKCEIAV